MSGPPGRPFFSGLVQGDPNNNPGVAHTPVHFSHRLGEETLSFFSPVLRTPAAKHRLVNQRNGVIVAEAVVAAFDSASRRRGLLGLDAMPAGQALIIAPSNAIHTWSMRFAIDVAFITRSGRIVKIRSTCPRDASRGRSGATP